MLHNRLDLLSDLPRVTKRKLKEKEKNTEINYAGFNGHVLCIQFVLLDRDQKPEKGGRRNGLRCVTFDF